MSDPETNLMQRIKAHWGSLIDIAVHSSSIPDSFLAALIAGESGGQPDATRFEPAVFKRLSEEYPEWNGERTTNNATSWGLLQVLGENYPGDPLELADPQTNLNFGVSMLAGFAQHYELDLSSEFEALFRCWNSGEPHGKTYDPEYVPNGLIRMKIYDGLS